LIDVLAGAVVGGARVREKSGDLLRNVTALSLSMTVAWLHTLAAAERRGIGQNTHSLRAATHPAAGARQRRPPTQEERDVFARPPAHCLRRVRSHTIKMSGHAPAFLDAGPGGSIAGVICFLLIPDTSPKNSSGRRPP